MNSAPEVPHKKSKKLPKTQGDTVGGEPKLPTGISTIEIIKNDDTKDLKTAAAEANKALEHTSNGMKITVVTDNEAVNTATQPDQATPDTPEIIVAVGPPEVQEPQATIEQKPETVQTVEPQQVEDLAPNVDNIEQETGEDTSIGSGITDDPETSRAIDEIVAAEADTVLDAEDEEREAIELAKEPKRPSSRLGRFFAHSWVRWSLFLIVFASLIAVSFTPTSRYYVLNKAGVHSTLSLKVVDLGTKLPLKNFTVSAGGSTSQTDDTGIARLDNVRLGNTTLVIEKRAFSTIEKNIVVGWGSNPLGDFEAQAVGEQYTFLVMDYLSGKPIEAAEASSSDGNALADKEGKIVLTLDTAQQEDSEQVDVTIVAPGYRQEVVRVTVSNKEVQSVKMVQSRKHTFISKRSGTFDIYTIDIDGENEKKIVQGTGLERDDIALVNSQTQPIAALVSTRERVTSTSGYLLSTLYLVDTASGNLTKIDQSERIVILGWTKTGQLVYTKISDGGDGTDPARQRIMSYDTQSTVAAKQLAAANYFNDILMVGDKIYYAPSRQFAIAEKPGVLAVTADGLNTQTILADVEAFSLQRSSYETMDFNVNNTWYSYPLLSTGGEAVKGQTPASLSSKIFNDNQATNFSLWVDERDGKGVLLSYDRTARKDAEVTNYRGLKTPVQWLNDTTVVFRVNDSRETADYVISLDGGEARKITTVTDSLGFGSR